MTKVHLSLSQWPLVRRLGATGRPVRLVLQLVAGAACLLGSFVWATEHLSDLAGPAPMTVAVARLDDWPEIKNGVPDLKRVDPVRPSSFEPLPLAHARSSEAPAKPADTAVQMGELPTSGQHISRLEPSSPSTAPVVQGAVPTPEAEKPEGVPDAGIQSSSRVSAPTEQAEAHDTPTVSMPASLSKTAPAGGETQARREGAVAPRREGQQAPGSIQASPSASRRDQGKATKKSETRPTARSERKRVASTEPFPAVEKAVASVAPAETEVKPPAEGEQVRVLGVALPTGRKIKECLLELRC
jgi:hypothetical protein